MSIYLDKIYRHIPPKYILWNPLQIIFLLILINNGNTLSAKSDIASENP
jgi:hypothetical protein